MREVAEKLIRKVIIIRYIPYLRNLDSSPDS